MIINWTQAGRQTDIFFAPSPSFSSEPLLLAVIRMIIYVLLCMWSFVMVLLLAVLNEGEYSFAYIQIIVMYILKVL